MVHTHGCLAVMQAKLETELITLLTGAQVGRLFFYNAVSVEARFVIFIQVLSLLVLLVSLVCLVVGLCTGFAKISFVPS